MFASIQKMTLAGLFAMALALPAAGLADEKHDHGAMGGEMKAKGMMHHGCAKAMGGDMIALADGGLVVKCGNQLMKYDKDLKPVAKAVIECDCCAKDAKCDKEKSKDMEKPAKPVKPAETPKK